jgi:hypothetical protein
MSDLEKILCRAFSEQLGKNADVLTKLALDAWDKYGEPVDLPGPDSVMDPIIRSTLAKVASPLILALAKHLAEIGKCETPVQPVNVQPAA